MLVNFSFLDSDIQSVEQLLLYLLDVYYAQNYRNVVGFKTASNEVLNLPLIVRNPDIVTVNGQYCDEFFVRIPKLGEGDVGTSLEPLNDYNWRFGTHVEEHLYGSTPAPFLNGWKTANLAHSAP